MKPDPKQAQEQVFIDRLIKLLRAKMQRENLGTMHRDAHPKQHGMVKAEFMVEKNLPSALQKGVFQPGKCYQAWVRFSNQNAPQQEDYKKDIRGAAIKLMRVPGEKIPCSDGNQTSQDFVTISTPVFITRDLKQFWLLIQALIWGKVAIMLFFILHPRALKNFLRANQRFYSPLEARYWSTTPYQLGDHLEVKYSLVPHSFKPTAIPEQPSSGYMRQNMAQQLSAKAYYFDFCVQPRTNPRTMSLDDPGKAWPEDRAPFIKVATLRIPQQTFDTPEQQALGEQLSFTPWHCLPAHRPLGGINRARQLIYDTLSEFRHQRNGLRRAEPISFDIVSADREDSTLKVNAIVTGK